MTSDHWQNIYTTKADHEVSWTQKYPKTAVDYLESLELDKDARIIDVGGGASNFADALLELGYVNITVLDISDAALGRSKARLGEKAGLVEWIVSDINDFEAENAFDFWYDRAVFHFLTEDDKVERYKSLVSGSVTKDGHFLLGTFSENGPLKCSGLEIRQYSESGMCETFNPHFKSVRCFKESHKTPFDTFQEFQFCGFVRI